MSRLGVIFLTWRRSLQKGIHSQGISLKQLHLLKRLRKEEFLHPADIAELLFCDRPTATVIIRNLEKSGWVHKTRDPENKKRYRVRITPAGRKKAQEAGRLLKQVKKKINPLTCFNREERRLFEDLAGKLYKHMQGRE